MKVILIAALVIATIGGIAYLNTESEINFLGAIFNEVELPFTNCGGSSDPVTINKMTITAVPKKNTKNAIVILGTATDFIEF